MYEPFEPEGEERTTPTLPMWGTIDRTPVVSKARSSNYVPAPRPRQTIAAPVIDAPIVDTAAAWESRPSVIETGTPIHRSIATLIRATPVVLLLAVLGLPAAWYLTPEDWDWRILAICFVAGFALIGYLIIVLWDLEHNSPSSTERHRIDRAFSLKRQELRQTHELRRAIVESYLDHMNAEREE